MASQYGASMRETYVAIRHALSCPVSASWLQPARFRLSILQHHMTPIYTPKYLKCLINTSLSRFFLCVSSD
jgi:hypothetical protein